MWAVVLVKNGQFVEVLSDGLTLSGAIAFAAGAAEADANRESSRGTPVVMPSPKAVDELSEMITLLDASDSQTRAAMLQASRGALVASFMGKGATDTVEQPKCSDAESGDDGSSGEASDAQTVDADDPTLRALFVLVDHSGNGQGVWGEAMQGQVAKPFRRILRKNGHTAKTIEVKLRLSEILTRGKVSPRVSEVPRVHWLPQTLAQSHLGRLRRSLSRVD